MSFYDSNLSMNQPKLRGFRQKPNRETPTDPRPRLLGSPVLRCSLAAASSRWGARFVQIPGLPGRPVKPSPLRAQAPHAASRTHPSGAEVRVGLPQLGLGMTRWFDGLGCNSLSSRFVVGDGVP
jgi:hypothetical protein